MKSILVYLTFNGNCREAFNLYKNIFGGDFSSMEKYRDMPPREGYEVSEDKKEKIMPVSLRINDETVLMGSDSNSYSGDINFGDNISLTVNAKDKEEADRLFNELSDGGKITMPMSNTFWGAYFGMVNDKFDINWMISLDIR